MAHPVSILFCPADKPELILKATKGVADAICIDMEDGVKDISSKQQARKNLNKNVALVLENSDKKVFVRINNDKELSKDIEVLSPNIHAVVLPKAETQDQIIQLDKNIYKKTLTRIPIVAMIESPKALLHFEDKLESQESLMALALGTEDFSLSVGSTSDASIIEMAFLRLVLLAKSFDILFFGMPFGISDYQDRLEDFQKAALFSKNNGADGAFAIHPKQIEVINIAFAYSKEEVEQAREEVKIFEQALKEGKSVTSFNGKMIDEPVYQKALKIIHKQNNILI